MSLGNTQVTQNLTLILFSETAKYMKFGKTPLVQAGQWYEVGGVRKINEGRVNFKTSSGFI
jgi:hypothetical protein